MLITTEMKNSKQFVFSAFWVVLFLISCNRDEIKFENPAQLLKFSRDTVFCDTVYNQTRSETYAVKIYNTENQDIKIPHIFLSGGSASPYKINIDGKSGNDFTNIPLRKKDSLYIFVEIAPVAKAPQAIAEDQIIFDNPAGRQHVTLLSVVQDAEYYIQQENNPIIISNNTTWSSNKAKVIFGKLTIAEGKTLTIEKGTKVYFHKNSSLNISKNATLNVNGDLGSEVIFRGDRNDTAYDTIPANWQGIKSEAGAKINLNYGKIFGGNTALDLTQTTANIANTIIHSFDHFGIYSVNSTVSANNLVMNNCGTADVAIYKGGTYDFSHCTLANYWSMASGRDNLGIIATNTWTNPSGTAENGPLTLNIKNSIVYGANSNSIIFKPVQGQTFNYLIQNSLLKYSISQAGFNFDGNPYIMSSMQNLDPGFLNHGILKMNLRLKQDSPARGKGNPATANNYPLDLLKISRTPSPTIGAYQ